jgi:peptidyl-prolyl cis-trans isomerase C
MKITLSLLLPGVLLCAETLSAQTPPPLSPATPPQTRPQAAPAAPSTPDVPPDTVVAVVDGKKYTAGEVNKLVGDFPPQIQLAIKGDPKRTLGLLLMTRHLASEAQKAKLDQESPLKETLEYQRMNALAQAEINQVRNFQINPTPDDGEQYYKKNPAKYQEAKIKVIYVAFTANPQPSSDPKAKKTLTEAEAKTKIEGLRKKLLAGADFGQVAKENSDDKESASQDGDFPALKRTSPYPEPIKNAVFALKPGEISEPLRQPNGFYLIRLEQVKSQPYEEVRVEIYEEMKTKEFNEWMQALQKRYEVKVENPAYFAAKPALPAAH